MSRKLHTRPGDIRLPGQPPLPKPPALRESTNPHRAWRFHDWAWDVRAMCWRAEWHHVSLPITVRDFDEYVAGTRNGRHWVTASTPAAVLDLLEPNMRHEYRTTYDDNGDSDSYCVLCGVDARYTPYGQECPVAFARVEAARRAPRQPFPLAKD